MAFDEIKGNQPSRNPANDNSMAGVFREVFKKLLQKTDDMLPARVEVYDRVTNRVKVQPLTQLITTDNQALSRASIPSIPVLQMGGGGYMISFPLQQGDLGWIKANDRDISLFLQSFDESPPNTHRMHTFEDAVFIPDQMTDYTIAAEDLNNLVIQKTDGSIKISIGDTIKIENLTSSIEVDSAETTITGDVTLEGNIDVNGDLVVDGKIEATGDIDSEGEVTALAAGSGVTLSGHTHISNGPGNPTNPPTAGT